MRYINPRLTLTLTVTFKPTVTSCVNTLFLQNFIISDLLHTGMVTMYLTGSISRNS